jgi:putative SOS response-associated peptidase YedK
MCGRFTLTKPEDIQPIFQLDELPLTFTASYNIAPSQQVPIVYYDETTSKARCQLMTWGLVPSWSKEHTSKYSTINARIETVTSKPSFRRLVGRQNCIIPTNGFYEWKAIEQEKHPMFIGFKNAPLFGLAGLWDEWHDKISGEVLQTFTIITLPSSGPVEAIHNRMPAIVMPDNAMTWIKPDMWTEDHLQGFLLDEPYDKLSPYEVSKLVNNPRNNELGCITPV